MPWSASGPASRGRNFPASGRRARNGGCRNSGRGWLTMTLVAGGASLPYPGPPKTPPQPLAAPGRAHPPSLTMPAKKPITIIGGGLAGPALGIGLRPRSIPVTVWEAGHYPRHRVCCEFISGCGHETLARLGLRERLLEAGAIPART